MNTTYLVDLANRIGEFFEVYPDRTESELEIAQHLKKFWEPRMRRALLAHVQQRHGDGLDPLVLAAVQHHSEMLAPVESSRAVPPAAS